MNSSYVSSITAVRTKNLVKSFDKRIAVDNLTFEVRKGELFGLVGPDGSGKTTTLRLLAAIMEPDSGDAWVAGSSVRSESEAIKNKIGYMPQRFGLYEDLTVMENILFYADLFEVPGSERQARLERLLGFSNLTPFKNRLAGNLSGGMKQKLGLACALIHTPEVLFLDEPTNGVDPVSRRDFWKILYELLKEQITIFVSTAYLDEAERCMRVGLMHHGRILKIDEPAAIRRSTGRPMIEVRVDDPRAAVAAVRGMAGVLRVSIYGDRLHVDVTGRNIFALVRRELERAAIGVKAEREVVPSLEDIFIAMVGS